MADLKFAASFQVFATCEKCKSRIESNLMKLESISHAKWNIDSKLMLVNYNPDQIVLEEIHQSIAATGYDTELCNTTKIAYRKLPKSCQH